MTHRTRRTLSCAARVAWLAVAVALLAAACGDDPTESADQTAQQGDSASTSTPTACELFSEEEAEAVIGADLDLLAASDDYRCSYVGVEDSTYGAVLSYLPTLSNPDDLQVVREAYGLDTIEEISGLGDDAFFHDDGPIHDVQFIKDGVWVTVAVAGLAVGDDFRSAALEIAESAAERL